MIFKKTPERLNQNNPCIVKLLRHLIITIVAVALVSCHKKDIAPEYPGTVVDLGTYKLMAYSASKQSKYLVVFESGLGNDHTAWYSTGKSTEILSISTFLDANVLLYDRAGYGKSGINTEPATINNLTKELEAVVDKFANGRKVLLVGHSLGGFIIRDYAIKNPKKVAGLVFVDTSHEKYGRPSQGLIDSSYIAFKTAYGANSGIASETLQLTEDFKYMEGLPHLPDVPVIAITSMKIEANHTAADMQLRYQAVESLKVGLKDFTHITTLKSGHFIQLEEPELVLGNIKLLLSKFP